MCFLGSPTQIAREQDLAPIRLLSFSLTPCAKTCIEIIPKNIPRIYSNISKTLKINTKYQAATGPARARGRPGTARPRAWAGLRPGRAGGRLGFCIYLKYLGYILDIFRFQGCVSLERLCPMHSYWSLEGACATNRQQAHK